MAVSESERLDVPIKVRDTRKWGTQKYCTTNDSDSQTILSRNINALGYFSPSRPRHFLLTYVCMAGKQAKTLTEADLSKILRLARLTRYPERDLAIVLLSVKAGLRACEIAGLTWAMVLDANGRLASVLEVRDGISKRKRGRIVPLNDKLRKALAALYELNSPDRDDPIIESERGGPMRSMAVVNWFARLYRRIGLKGCSSHSGRRTFITNAARMVHKVGGSLRDVQQLAGHSSISMTQRYIEGHTRAKRSLVNLI